MKIKKINESIQIFSKFKKIIQILLLILILLFLNIGYKYPLNSEAKTNNNSEYQIEILNLKTQLNSLEDNYNKYVKMYENLYKLSFKQQIEFESEIIIPKDFEFKYIEFIYNVANEFNIPSRIAFRLIYKESIFNHNAKSFAGAKGIMQLMPNTKNFYYKKYYNDIINISDSVMVDIYIGLKYLKDNYEFWRSRGNSENFSWKLALATYNAGIKPVIKYKNIPPYKETEEFVKFITKPHSNPSLYTIMIKENKLKELKEIS